MTRTNYLIVHNNYDYLNWEADKLVKMMFSTFEAEYTFMQLAESSDAFSKRVRNERIERELKRNAKEADSYSATIDRMVVNRMWAEWNNQPRSIFGILNALYDALKAELDNDAVRTNLAIQRSERYLTEYLSETN